ncbi:hypothetical protein [Streptomyces sp. enrichment culture]|uniref:hypothetical protein n=1 Tax=Streptomyces sp. enrichment culture TaxID=1795815 RepID=UPI003F548422
MANPSEPEKKTAGTDGSDAGQGAAAGHTRWGTVAVSALATLLVASELSLAGSTAVIPGPCSPCFRAAAHRR